MFVGSVSSRGWSITEEQPERRIEFWLELKGRRTGVSSYHVLGVSGQQPSSCLSFNVGFYLVRRSTQTAGEPTSSCRTSDTLTPGSTTPFISKTLSLVRTLTVMRAFESTFGLVFPEAELSRIPWWTSWWGKTSRLVEKFGAEIGIWWFSTATSPFWKLEEVCVCLVYL